MADLFSVTAPLRIRLPGSGEWRPMAECMRHPEGLLYFELYWHQGHPRDRVHLVLGSVSGEGPWRVGEYVVDVLGCEGTDADLAAEFSAWQEYLQQAGDDYPPPELVRAIARKLGAEV